MYDQGLNAQGDRCVPRGTL